MNVQLGIMRVQKEKNISKHTIINSLVISSPPRAHIYIYIYFGWWW